MPDTDPLQVLRDWIGENDIGFEPHLADAFAALETERRECEGDAIGFAQKVDELAALRAEVLKVAEEMETTVQRRVAAFLEAYPKYNKLETNQRPAWMNEYENIAARLRKACE